MPIGIRTNAHLVSPWAAVECWAIDHIISSLVLIIAGKFICHRHHSRLCLHVPDCSLLLPDCILLLMNGVDCQLKVQLGISLMLFQIFTFDLLFTTNSRVFAKNPFKHALLAML